MEPLNPQTKGTNTGWQSIRIDRSKGEEITGGPRIQVKGFVEKRGGVAKKVTNKEQETILLFDRH